MGKEKCGIPEILIADLTGPLLGPLCEDVRGSLVQVTRSLLFCIKQPLVGAVYGAAVNLWGLAKLVCIGRRGFLGQLGSVGTLRMIHPEIVASCCSTRTNEGIGENRKHLESSDVFC